MRQISWAACFFVFPTKSKCILHIDHNLTAQCAVCNMLVEYPCFKRFKVISTVRILEITAFEASQNWLRLSPTAPHPARAQFSWLFSFFSLFAHWKWRGVFDFSPIDSRSHNRSPGWTVCYGSHRPTPPPLLTPSLFETPSSLALFLYLHLMLK